MDKSKKKKTAILNFFRSMRLHVALAIVLSGIALSLLLCLFAGELYSRRSISLLEEQIRSYASKISVNMVNSAYFATASSTSDISKELYVTAQLYDGRIIVLNEDLKVIFDSFDFEVGKTLISTESLNALSKNENQYLDNENKRVELSLPLLDNITDPKSPKVAGVMIFTASTESAVKLKYYLERRLGAVAAVLMFVDILLAIILSARIGRPFKQINNTLNNVGNGIPEGTMALSDYSELDTVNESMDAMLSRISELEESRQEFVSNVSHELKTPMTSIKVLADSLLNTPNAPAEMYRDFMVDINEEIDRENKIITDLLSLVKLDRKNGDMHIAVVSINELMQIILKRLKPIAQEKNVELIFESYRNVFAEVDEVKLSLAITNLVENAIKYNKENGWVRVSLNADHRYFLLKVTDSGIGIPEEARERIFERFYRVDKARSRETGGTGLGLAITKNVVIMHNGTIKVDEDIMGGSVFSVRIPLSYITKS